jgi:hypothetical protein
MPVNAMPRDRSSRSPVQTAKQHIPFDGALETERETTQRTQPVHHVEMPRDSVLNAVLAQQGSKLLNRTQRVGVDVQFDLRCPFAGQTQRAAADARSDRTPVQGQARIRAIEIHAHIVGILDQQPDEEDRRQQIGILQRQIHQRHLGFLQVLVSFKPAGTSWLKQYPGQQQRSQYEFSKMQGCAPD